MNEQVMIRKIDNGWNVVTPRNIEPPENIALLNPMQQQQAQQAYMQAQQAAANDLLIHYCRTIKDVQEYIGEML